MKILNSKSDLAHTISEMANGSLKGQIQITDVSIDSVGVVIRKDAAGSASIKSIDSFGKKKSIKVEVGYHTDVTFEEFSVSADNSGVVMDSASLKLTIKLPERTSMVYHEE